MDANKTYIAVKDFVRAWQGRGSEKSDAQSFWTALLQLLGMKNPAHKIFFEQPIRVDGRKCSIDAVIPSTRVLIEQKSRGVELDKPLRQSDGEFLTPFQQAIRYTRSLPRSQMPRWIVTCNFDEMRIYDLNQMPSLVALFTGDVQLEPYVVDLNRLESEYARLNFLVDPNDENVYPEIKISKNAASFIRKIYAAFVHSYGSMNSARRDALNKICVRLVFCFYAEDSMLFRAVRFREFIRQAADRRQALIDLFDVLNTPEERREPNLRAELKKFPYVNGGLFADANLEIPPIDVAMQHYLTDRNFSWREISPTIFGAMFEGTLNFELIRPGGMHYTSPANIHRVIDPLFLDDLHDQFQSICRKTTGKSRALEDFQDKIASLTFLDPACGSGNFLTETYLSLRRLENEIFEALLAIPNYTAPCEIKVSIEQFYGIEINDYAVAVANTAMWISEHQMLDATNRILHTDFPSLPLKRSARIVCANALDIDWHEVTKGGVDYIIGNPPFSGARLMSADNKAALLRTFDGWKNAGNLDFVCCWFKRAAQFMLDTGTRAAFVATNSITQGETVGILWSKLLEVVHIDFAHRTFKWTQESDDDDDKDKRKKASELDETAAVHCVIVGFSCAPNKKPRIIFDGDKKIEAHNINGYLLPASNFYVTGRSTPLCAVPSMGIGNKPIDGGNYLFTPDEYEDFIKNEPRSKKYFRRWYGAEEFINGKVRYCLWLGEATVEEIMSMPTVAERVEAVRCYRRSSKSAGTRKIADRPTRFHVENMPKGNFIVVPEVSGDRRKYIPMGFMTPDNLCSNKLMIVPNADLFHFGVLESIVNMAWMRVVCGRHGTSYDYSATIVYNNFPWCLPSPSIERTAQKILDARARYPAWTLAKLYNDETMPVELRAAHQQNDAAVLEAYGFDGGLSELEIVVRLMAMYEARLNVEKK